MSEHCIGRPAILMFVFNPIEYDGRVKRSINTLKSDFDITLVCPIALNNKIHESIDGVRILRPCLPSNNFSNFIRLLVFWFHCFFISFRVHPELVYSHDFDLALLGLIIGKMHSSKVVYDAHELILPGAFVPESRWLKIYRWAESFSVSHCDMIIAANKERSLLMMNHYRLKEPPKTVRNVVSRTVGTIPQKAILDLYPDLVRSGNQCFVAYIGDINFQRGLRQLLEAHNKLPNNFIFIVAGNGPDCNRVKNIARENSRVKYLGVISQRLVQDVFSVCDIGVVIYSVYGLNNLYCSPNKIFECAQAGIPVVTTAQPVLIEMIDKYRIGVVAGTSGCESTSQQFAAAILEVNQDPDRYKNRIASFIDAHSDENEQLTLLESLSECLKANKANA